MQFLETLVKLSNARFNLFEFHNELLFTIMLCQLYISYQPRLQDLIRTGLLNVEETVVVVRRGRYDVVT